MSKTIEKNKILEMMDKVFESQRENIVEEIQKQSSLGKTMLGVDFGSPDGSYNVQVVKKGFRIMPKTGSTELLSPDGVVLMRDGEIVEEPVEIKINYRQVCFR